VIKGHLVKTAIDHDAPVSDHAALEAAVKPRHAQWRHDLCRQVGMQPVEPRSFNVNEQVDGSRAAVNRQVQAHPGEQGKVIVADRQRIRCHLHGAIVQLPVNIPLQNIKR